MHYQLIAKEIGRRSWFAGKNAILLVLCHGERWSFACEDLSCNAYQSDKQTEHRQPTWLLDFATLITCESLSWCDFVQVSDFPEKVELFKAWKAAADIAKGVISSHNFGLSYKSNFQGKMGKFSKPVGRRSENTDNRYAQSALRFLERRTTQNKTKITEITEITRFSPKPFVCFQDINMTVERLHSATHHSRNRTRIAVQSSLDPRLMTQFSLLSYCRQRLSTVIAES